MLVVQNTKLSGNKCHKFWTEISECQSWETCHDLLPVIAWSSPHVLAKELLAQELKDVSEPPSAWGISQWGIPSILHQVKLQNAKITATQHMVPMDNNAGS